MKKVFLILLIGTLFVVGFFCWQSFSDGESSKDNLVKIVESLSLRVEKPKTTKLLFVGDIMLDRGVEYQIQKNKNDFYPFEKISSFVKQFDLAIANLEGPIVENPVDFPDSSLQFAFASTTATSLAKAGFNLVSLANNHTLNMKQQGLAETKEFLNKAGIDFVGDPAYCADTPIYQKDGIAILGFNITFPFNCSGEEIADVIKTFRASSTDDFLIITMHWGEEYQPINSQIQQDFAQQIIDHGADLIIGSHPHVVQNIEEYKGKLIFYSLGNFIFDQHFSEEVQEGLAIGLEITGKNLEYQLYPLSAGRSQPYLMESESAIVFLANLAQRSNPQLFGLIKRGIINK